MASHDDVKAERDRLAAENAELKRACEEMGEELSIQRQLELEAKCHGDLEESHKIMVDVVAERDAELAAANATLDALREAVHPDERRSWSALDAVHAILYPRPAALAEEKTNG